jgi:predicted enzyme related to lactoylglutathione lyase
VASATALPGCLGPPVQIAYAVPDAEAEARRWVRDGGVGPFFLRSHIEVRDVVHRGRPGVFDHTSAYAQWGTLMVELVQDHGTGPSAVRDVYAPDESGLHHVAFMVDDLDAALDSLGRLGLETAMSATTSGGVEFHFVDARASHGHMLELYERSDRLAGFYAAVARAADGWDGTDPIRPT